MFWMHAHGVRWHADETPRKRGDQERRQPKDRNARRIPEWLRSQHRFASFRGWFGRPRFKWNYPLRRAHLALSDDTLLPLATAQQLNCQTDFLEFPRPHSAARSVKMALLVANVNLWKTPEVS